MWRPAFFLAIGAALWLAQPVAAAEPPTVEGLTVKGQREKDEALRARVRAYVKDMTRRGYGETLMRWGDPLCPFVAGMPADQAAFIRQRVVQVARQAGVPLPRGRDCRPNLIIVVTREPAVLLKAWKRRDANLFGRQIPAKVNAFMTEDSAVRLWRNWEFRPADGTAGRREPTGGYGGALVVPNSKASRIVSNAVKSIWGAVVIVDADKMAGVKVRQLADYVALASLADVKEDGAGGSSTILRAFEDSDDPSGEAPPTELSDFDRAFLEALYGTNQSLFQQPAQIADRMTRALEQPPSSPP